MNETDSDRNSQFCGVTPFPDEPHELALVLYETCSMHELANHLQKDADESVLKKWNLTHEQYREELLFAKLLLEND